MSHFSVWAPNVRKVELSLQGRRAPMSASQGGWWSVEIAGAGPGTDYAFCLDGSEPLPDPRSGWQPYGANGPSRVLDHAAFPWTDRGWQSVPLSSAVIYELHVGTFTPEGTFEAVIGKLDHLVALGITHVELLPVNEFSGSRGWGYDGVDLYSPHHVYGGPEGLKKLVDACHARDLGIILDVVYNHSGIEACYLSRFGPYFADWYRTPWGQAVNFDGRGSDEVRRFVADNALMWFRDYHADGLRIDAVHAIVDTSAVHMLEQLSQEVGELKARTGRQLFLIAESALNDPRVVRPPEVGGYGIDAQWSDDFHHALHVVLTGEQQGYYQDFGKLADLAKALEHAFVYDGRYSPLRGRRHGRPAGDSPGDRFLAYLQNHDQIGNRAMGERIGHLVSVPRLKIGSALTLTSPFVPMIFQGEEWAASSPFQFFSDYQNPALGKAVTEGRRREFAEFHWDPARIPDPQDPETFRRSKLDWSELDKEPHASVLEWYRRLIRLRTQCGDLSAGPLDRVRVRFDERERWLVVERQGTEVVCNLSAVTQIIRLSRPGPRQILLASEGAGRITTDGIELPADSVAVVAAPGGERLEDRAAG